MKQSLQMNIGHQLTLTPQLQQAIRLLQLSTLDLHQEIQQFAESNPLLEVQGQDEASSSDVQSDQDERLSEEINGEGSWSLMHFNANKRRTFEDAEGSDENLYPTKTNLQDHLRWQLNLASMPEEDKLIATTVIDAVDEHGFLTISLEDLYSSFAHELGLIPVEIDRVRHCVQLFDPVGCGSKNLAEALLVQLDQLPNPDRYVELSKQIIAHDIELLGHHNYRQLMKQYRLSTEILGKVLQVIKGLNPRPGNAIQSGIIEYVVPDVLVKKINGRWQAKLNPHALPDLSINSHYASLIQRANNSGDNQFLKNNLQEARWFLKSIQSRQETLLKVAQCMVEYQQDFFEEGEVAMKPLILNDIAMALGMHESTISRVTTQKYMHTPRGLFELKHFFSSHVGTVTGGECSSIAIRAIIKKLIAAENRRKPLSDSKIAQQLGVQGLQVARRTVAKYREAMGIASSNERKAICIEG